MTKLCFTAASILWFSLLLPAQTNYPEGFNEEIIYDQFEIPVGFLPTDTTVSLVYELSGKVWVILDGVPMSEPVIDITEEVGWFGDNGMIGAVLHPDFLENGYIYLYYTVDRHHYLYFGTDEYDPGVTEVNTATMGRITRYTIDTSDFETLIPNSRHVLLGENVGEGIPVGTVSHSVGALVFGEDGSLLATTGDGSTWVGMNNMGYNGTGPLPAYAFDSIALADGVLRPDEMLGSYRAQYLDGLNGKVLRIHPETGEGLANNPFYNAEDPYGARSKIWALGLRNPYRMSIKPGTGSGSLENGFPGIIYLADVGDWVWEELNIVSEPGLNFGWPMFQGPVAHDFYRINPTRNTNAPNPAFGTNGCTQEYFNYQETVLESNAQHNYFFPNPCNEGQEIPDDIIKFVHRPPALAWANEANTTQPYAVIPTYDSNGEESFTPVSSPDSPFMAMDFQGLSSSGGDFLFGPTIPEEYQNWFVAVDFSGWLRAFKFNDSHELEDIEVWNENIGRPVNIIRNPNDGCIYVTTIFPSEIKRICFGGNLKPVLIYTPEIKYGPGPLEVQFDASQSYDPEGDSLIFHWDFGDNTSSSLPSPNHIFDPGNNQQLYNVVLSVSDTSGATATAHIPISVNNSPPQVNIISIQDDELYSTKYPTSFDLIAEVNDAENEPHEMQYTWTLYLHHNTHFHLLDTWEGNNNVIDIYPTGCSQLESYWYRITVDIEDPGGLTDSDFKYIYPDCEGILPGPHDFTEKPYLVLPNPSYDIFEIESASAFDDPFVFELYRPDGARVDFRSVPHFNQRNYLRINLGHLSAGIYIIKFRLNDQWYQEKLVKLDR